MVKNSKFLSGCIKWIIHSSTIQCNHQHVNHFLLVSTAHFFWTSFPSGAAAELKGTIYAVGSHRHGQSQTWNVDRVKLNDLDKNGRPKENSSRRRITWLRMSVISHTLGCVIYGAVLLRDLDVARWSSGGQTFPETKKQETHAEDRVLFLGENLRSLELLLFKDVKKNITPKKRLFGQSCFQHLRV